MHFELLPRSIWIKGDWFLEKRKTTQLEPHPRIKPKDVHLAISRLFLIEYTYILLEISSIVIIFLKMGI